MLQVNGYEIREQIYQGNRFTISTALRIADQKKVILKACRSEYPSLQVLGAIKNEFDILNKLNFPLAIKANDLIKQQHRLILVLEDDDSCSLKIYLKNQPLSLSAFFDLALQLVDGIEYLHSKNIIHKDINPSNIIISPETLKIKFIDFEISSQFAQEVAETVPSYLEGTLAYLAPEQTGRMNAIVDYRADFYSLGVTFYEMLTGRVPFQTEDILELIYNHLANNALSVNELNSEIPQTVADIIKKLMSKLPEERYKSATGLKSDLQKCQQQWRDNQSIDNFALATHDFSKNLNFPQKLYGRESEAKQLLDSFEHICQGHTECLLIAGYSGLGKTSLVKEIYKPITQKRGYFISGKYSLLNRNTPYSGMIAAFQELTERLLSENQEKLFHIKTDLLTALGNNGQVIINVIPKLELIIGKQPSLVELSPEQAQSRFLLAFQSFIMALAQASHPLVMFLDDLQWADSASLEFLGQLFNNQKLGYFLLIGAYRDNEITINHPLNSTLQTLKNSNVNINFMNLQPLAIEDISQYLKDSMNGNVTSVNDLSDHIFNKTQGNPFYINEFVRMLDYHKLLSFSSKNKQWQWDIKLIEEQSITGNVVDLLLKRIREFSMDMQELLSLAACVGYVFNVEMLAKISEKTLPEVVNYLWAFMELDLVKPAHGNYQTIYALKESGVIDNNVRTDKISFQFIHDKVHEAAYSLMPDNNKSLIHLKIGRLYLHEKSLAPNDERLFTVLNHFMHELKSLTDNHENLTLAEYCLWAGQKAQQSSAHSTAAKYHKAGIYLLSAVDWKAHHQLLFNLYKNSAECHYFIGDYDEAEKSLQLLYQHAQSKLESAEIASINVAMLNSQGKHGLALDVGVQALAKLGCHMPRYPKTYHVLWEILAIRFKMANKIATFNPSPMVDVNYIVADKLMAQLISVAYLNNKDLFVVLIYKMLNLYIKYGYTDNFPFACAMSAHISLNALGRYEEGFAFASLSERISQLLPMCNGVACQRFIFDTFINNNKYPMIDALARLERNHQQCLELGNIVYGFYCLGTHDLILLLKGLPLKDTHQAFVNEIAYTIEHKITEYNIYLPAIERTLASMLSADAINFLPTVEDFEKQLSQTGNNGEKSQSYYYYILFSYLSNNYHQTLQACEVSEPYYADAFGMPMIGQVQFCYALAITACYKDFSRTKKWKYLLKLKSIHKTLKTWAKWSPDNFLHYELLISAEYERITKPSLNTIKLYNTAIETAHKNQFMSVLAIANECAARFCMDMQLSNLAKPYIEAAYYAYVQWGANAKCRMLLKSYQDWLQNSSHTNETHTQKSFTHTHSFTTSMTPSVDLLSVLKSAQAISGEIELGQLLRKLIVILLENASAQRSVILMKEHDNWFIKATGTSISQQVNPHHIEPIQASTDLPLSVIQYVQRTHEPLIVQNTEDMEHYAVHDDYLKKAKPRGFIVLPIMYQDELSYIFYLENKEISCSFSPMTLQTLKLLASQAAISLSNAQLYYRATHDALTGLSNRSLLFEQFDLAKKRAKQSNNIIAILFLDLDGFKKINDTLGHDAGDQLLLHFSMLLKQSVKKADLVARLGGDEFVIMLEALVDKQEAAIVAERILNQSKEPVLIAGQPIHIKTSIGISLYPAGGTNMDDLLKQADTALYQVKQAGKNNYQFYVAEDKEPGERI